MSYFEAQNPQCDSLHCPGDISIEIIPRTVDLGGFEVRRVLPSNEKRTVGPFVFWDQAGPGEFLQGHGLDVRPHPHICLSTMTYLFSGSLEHRDTLGSHQIILPGAVNLMTAGRGIAHSERTPQAVRNQPHHFFGIQCWLALPLAKEEMHPDFKHYAEEAIPAADDKSLRIRVVTGEFAGLKSPVITQNDALFVEFQLQKQAAISIPATSEERAIHILEGEIILDKMHYSSARMLVLKPGHEVQIQAATDAHFILLGGAPLAEPRYLWWNFVASRKERIEQAKFDWTEGKFGKIPGDDKEFIPLPK